MDRKSNELEILSSQVRQGNPVARMKLRALLIPALILIARETLQTGRARTELARRIVLEYRRAAATAGAAAAPASALLELVARRVSDFVVERAARTGASVDPGRETVVA